MTNLKMELDMIIVGDCLDVMAEMEDGCVDLAILDPPFNVGKDYGDDFDDNKSLESYKAWLLPRLMETERVLRTSRLIFIWMPMPYMWQWSKWLDFPFRVFAALKDCVQYRPTEVQWFWDPVLFWKKDGKRTLPVRMGKRDWHIGKTSRWRTQGEKWHPCPRPLDTVEYLISEFSLPGEIIWDGFMGSGTTAVAALKLGRHFYGCDINPEYVELANKRIEKTRLEMAQLSFLSGQKGTEL